MRRFRWGSLLAIAPWAFALGCGRIGFDEFGAGKDAALRRGPSRDGGQSGADARGVGGATPSLDASATGGASGRGGASGASGSSSAAGASSIDGSPGTPDATALDASGPDGAVQGVSVLVVPRAAQVLTAASVQLSASVTGSLDTSVVWSVAEGAAGGTVSAAGAYTAPASPGTYHVLATSNAEPSVAASSVISVSVPASATAGVWQDVTPAGINLDPAYMGSNYGVQDILADPAKPSDLYAFVSYQGVYRSQDYGQTWKKVSTGANAALLETGRPWSAAIDPDPRRPAATPPTLYTALGFGTLPGVFKSKDGGVSWARYVPPGSDVFAIDIDPYDGTHLICAALNTSAVAESTDGGVTWRAATAPPAGATASYPYFVDTGVPITTRLTWLSISQGGGVVGGAGIWRTKDSGKTWSQVSTMGHGGGSSQIFQAGGGRIYTGGDLGTSSGPSAGIYLSPDYGDTWSLVAPGVANGVTGTPTFLYAFEDWATATGVAPDVRRAPRGGAPWSSVATPAGMTNGPKHAAVVYDGAHYVIVGGDWNAGIWRYVEK